MIRRPPRSTPFPTRRSSDLDELVQLFPALAIGDRPVRGNVVRGDPSEARARLLWKDRKSTRLNSSHMSISYAVFCLKKKKKKINKQTCSRSSRTSVHIHGPR